MPDDALPALVAGLAATGSWQAGQIVVHTSGRHGVGVFDAGAARSTSSALALHPAMTFTGTAMDLDRLADCCFGVTAPEALRPVAEALVVEMGAEPVWIAEEDRPALPRGARARRQPPGHPRRPGDAGAGLGRGGRSRDRVLAPAAVRGARQRPAPG